MTASPAVAPCSNQTALAEIAEIMPSQKRCASFFCHSERSEESLISSMLTSMRCQPLLRDPSHSLRMTSVKAGYIKPRFLKSPRFPPEERSTRSMVNLSRQTSHASSTPCMIALSGSFLFSTCRMTEARGKGDGKPDRCFASVMGPQSPGGGSGEPPLPEK